MSTIIGFGIPPSLYRSSSQGISLTAEAVPPNQDAAGVSSASGGTTAQAVATLSVPSGLPVAPKLSADVIDALIRNQIEQTAGNTSAGASDQTTNLSGAAATRGQAATSSDSSSAPPTLQDIAAQFDPHNATHQQEEHLQGVLVSSGALSQKGGLAFFSKTVLSDWFDSQHYRIINGQLVATTPSAPGTLIGNDAPGGPSYDVVQRFQQSLAFDQSVGDTKGAAQDQKILDVLNRIEAIRNGGAA